MGTIVLFINYFPSHSCRSHNLGVKWKIIYHPYKNINLAYNLFLVLVEHTNCLIGPGVIIYQAIRKSRRAIRLSPTHSIKGMAYLHGEPNVVILRDLQPRNVFLVNTSGDHLKVGDFGLSKLINVQNSPHVYRIIGETESYRYMAPEVFKNGNYDKKADVFSFAMIVNEMLEGDPPLSIMNHMKLPDIWQKGIDQ
ncbi:Non-specific serine/threonine protein kinase [Handroanthus impetiginosus]|uniref:Non-specific serine/threonine protein kinase n=1 Tax=Handroanthus impetiginosus TaxID=429701 RepID=A0A2G9GIZ8_9LAMI|nr:Non-specific serine/threonine protein kinase [Handroanthus impetiginosus]